MLTDKARRPALTAAGPPIAGDAAIKLPLSVLHSERGGTAMTVCRALPLVGVLVALPFAAGAQFGGMPGLPGGPPGQVPGGEGLGRPPAGPPPACQELLELRDQTQRHGLAIQKANERKATVQEACKLFRTFLATEAKFIRDSRTTAGRAAFRPMRSSRPGKDTPRLRRLASRSAMRRPRALGPPGRRGTSAVCPTCREDCRRRTSQAPADFRQHCRQPAGSYSRCAKKPTGMSKPSRGQLSAGRQSRWRAGWSGKALPWRRSS